MILSKSQEVTESCSFIGFVEKRYLGSNKAAGQKASPMLGIELNFLVGNFTNESISFSKGKEFNNWFDD